MWVYGEEGLGTTFKIYLPLVEASADRSRPRPPMEATGGTETVLLVEDEPGVRRLARRVLERKGCTVLEAATGADALALCEREEGPIHLMLTDVVMPGMSGKELAGRLADVRPDTSVLFMSGYAEAEITHRGLLEPGLLFLEKPFTPDGLVRKVRHAIEAGADVVEPDAAG